MLNITLPDGSQRQFPGPVTVAEVAASIGAGLAKAALGGKVRFGHEPESGKLVDTPTPSSRTLRWPSSRPRTPTGWR
jgi:threonyl-tRNA synthetase